MYNPPLILRNGHIPVFFAGWRSDTYLLQKHGWELALHEFAGYPGYAHRLAMRHRSVQLDLISDPVVIGRGISPDREGLPKGMIFNMSGVARVGSFNLIVQEVVPKFKATDFGNPEFIELDRAAIHRHISLQECCYFKSFEEEKEIFIPKKELWTAQKHLDAILNLQKPYQAELREKARKAQWREEQKGKTSIETQIISVA